MIDTSVLVAGLIPDHEFHVVARPHVVLAADGRIDVAGITGLDVREVRPGS